MSRLSRGELEAILANALLRFEKDQLGRGPVETRAFLIENLIVIMARGVLTPEETALATIARVAGKNLDQGFVQGQGSRAHRSLS